MKTNIAILGAGDIAGKMALTVAEMPEIELYAVASRDLERAKAFAGVHRFQKAYGSYEQMLSDEGVDLVYIATPHSHHYEHAMMCLDHGKHALCEKAFTANAAQARRLLARAEEQNLLVTEALWTRFMPLSMKINEVLASGAIGTPTFLTANLGYLIADVERVKNPALAGGALLDVGVYPINFASMVFGTDVASVSAEAVMTDLGVDAMNNITMRFADGKVAFLYSSTTAQTDRQGVVYGDRGHIVVDNINNPERIRVFSLDREEVAGYEAPEQISGYEYEVRAAVEAIRAGRTECPEMPHSETLRIMELMDGLRASWGMKYPFEE